MSCIQCLKRWFSPKEIFSLDCKCRTVWNQFYAHLAASACAHLNYPNVSKLPHSFYRNLRLFIIEVGRSLNCNVLTCEAGTCYMTYPLLYLAAGCILVLNQSAVKVVGLKSCVQAQASSRVLPCWSVWSRSSMESLNSMAQCTISLLRNSSDELGSRFLRSDWLPECHSVWPVECWALTWRL